MRSVLPFALSLCVCFAACDDRADAPPSDPSTAPKAEAEATPAPAGDVTPKEATPSTASSRVVNVPLGDDVGKVLVEHAALARQAQLTPFVELWAQWCGPCKKLEAAMGDPRITKAFEGVYLIRLDSDAWGPKLAGTGLDSSVIPVFYGLDDQGKPNGRTIDGGAWGEDTPENMAPPLDAFFHATAS